MVIRVVVYINYWTIAICFCRVVFFMQSLKLRYISRRQLVFFLKQYFLDWHDPDLILTGFIPIFCLNWWNFEVLSSSGWATLHMFLEVIYVPKLLYCIHVSYIGQLVICCPQIFVFNILETMPALLMASDCCLADQSEGLIPLQAFQIYPT